MIICWLAGHAPGGEVHPEGYLHSERGIVPGWVYYCPRCGLNRPPNFKRGATIDIRNLWQRTVPPRIAAWRNRLYFARLSR